MLEKIVKQSYMVRLRQSIYRDSGVYSDLYELTRDEEKLKTLLKVYVLQKLTDEGVEAVLRDMGWIKPSSPPYPHGNDYILAESADTSGNAKGVF